MIVRARVFVMSNPNEFSLKSLDLDVPYGTPTQATSGSTGEQVEGRMGGASGEGEKVRVVGLVMGSRTGIVCCSSAEFGTAKLCGGLVGGKKGTKMCVKSNCKVASHQGEGKKAADAFVFSSQPGLEENYDEMLFTVASTDPQGVPTQVNLSPSLPRSFLTDEQLAEQSVRSQSIDIWKVTFSTIGSLGMLKESEPDDSARNSTLNKILKNADTSYAVTPKKQRREHSPSPLTESFEEILEDVYELNSADLQDSEAAFRLMAGSWNNLRDNMQRVADLATEAISRTRRSDPGLSDDVDVLEVKVAKLNALLGERSEEMGTLSVINLVSSLVTQLDALGLSVKGLEAWKVEFERNLGRVVSEHVVEAIRSNIFSGDYQNKLMKPLAQLLGKLSSGPGAEPGDLLDTELKGLKQRIAHLESLGRVAPVPAPAGATVFGATGIPGLPATWHAPPAAAPAPPAAMPPAPPPASAVGGIPSGVEADIKALQEQLRLVQGQLVSESVEVKSMLFSSLHALPAWVGYPQYQRYPHLFVDLMSFLSLSDNIKMDEASAAGTRVIQVKVGDSTPEYTAYLASYQMEVPTILGKGSNPNTTHTDRTLPAVPTFETWDTGLGRDGVYDRLMEMIDEGESTLARQISIYLTGEAEQLAQSLLAQAHKFWMTNATWLTKTHNELLARRKGDKKGAWILMTHSERAVLKVVRRARKIGQSRDPAHLLWGALQAHRVSKELVDLKFQGHPEVSIILHQHLIDTSVPRSVHEKLEKEVSELKKDLAAVKATADKALSTANKKKG